MNKFFIPTKNPDDLKWLLPEPDRLWKTGYSTKTLAYCWHEASGFPECVKKVLKKSNISLLENIKILLALPEYKVPLPPYNLRPSINNIFLLARGNNQLVSIMVEGIVSEPFSETVAEWLEDHNVSKRARLRFLLKKLNLEHEAVDNICYQLLFKAAAAVIEAKKFNSTNALILVHSFSLLNRRFPDYKRFVALFGMKAKLNSLTGPVKINGVNLYFGWVKGNKKYLEK